MAGPSSEALPRCEALEGGATTWTRIEVLPRMWEGVWCRTVAITFRNEIFYSV